MRDDGSENHILQNTDCAGQNGSLNGKYFS